jgi:hypothetical protein
MLRNKFVNYFWDLELVAKLSSAKFRYLGSNIVDTTCIQYLFLFYFSYYTIDTFFLLLVTVIVSLVYRTIYIIVTIHCNNQSEQ